MMPVFRFSGSGPRGRHGPLSRGRGTVDAEALRLAQGERPPPLCGHRDREAGPRRHRVHRHGPGVRPQDDPAGPRRVGGGGRAGDRPHPQKGGGRKRLIATDPAIEANFLKVLEDHTAGDPMRTDVRWTNLSRRQIATRVTELGTPIGRHVASQLLRKHRYRKRKPLKTRTMGPRHPARDAQFETMARLKLEYLAAGLRLVSIDTKNKE